MRVPVLQFRPGRPSDRRAPDLPDDRIGRERTRGLPAAPVRLRRVASTSLWIAILALAALLPVFRIADAQDPQTLISNFDQSNHGSNGLSPDEYALGFTTGANPDGYALTSIELSFSTQPTGLTVRVLTENSQLSEPGDEFAVLNNPASPSTGTNTFTAPAGTVLLPDTTYFMGINGTDGEVSFTNDAAEDSDSEPAWSIADDFYYYQGGSWLQRGSNEVFLIRVNGYIRMLPEIPAPDPANFARGPVHWLGQSQDEAQSSTHAFPARRNEISANQPSNPSGSLDLGPNTAPVSENLRQPSRGFYLTTTIDQPRDAPSLFHRAPDGGYAVEDAQSRRYELAPGAALIKLRLWHVYHHRARGLNSVQLLGGTTVNDRDNRLTQPLQVCLPAPDIDAERARIAVRGRYDRHWTILETTLTDDGRICARTVRIAWLVVVLQPPPPSAAA